MTDEVAFFMGSQVVGEFPRNWLPTMDGSYSYEPFRSPGHLNLHIEVKAGKAPLCFYGGLILYRSNQAPILGLLIAAFSSAAVVLGVRLLLDFRPGLAVSAMGIALNSKLGYGGEVPWNEVSGFTLVRYGRDYQLVVSVRHPRMFIVQGRWLYRTLNSLSNAMFGSPIRINAGLLDYPRADLISALDQYRSQYSNGKA